LKARILLLKVKKNAKKKHFLLLKNIIVKYYLNSFFRYYQTLVRE